MAKLRRVVWMIAGAISSGIAFGQATPGTLEFEVASIKLDDGPSAPNPQVESDQGVRYPRVPVSLLLSKAYEVRIFQLVGPAWIDQQLYTVAATLPPDATKADIPQMLQRLLADRFHMSVHRELRDAEVYAVTIGKDGSKLQACQPRSESEEAGFNFFAVGPQKPPPGMCPFRRAVINRITLFAMVETDSLDDLVRRLQGELDRPVVNRTGLQGTFSIYLKGASVCPPQGRCGQPDPTVPSMESEFQRLGLKLERRKAKIEYVVVDSGNRIPTEN